MSKWWQKSHCYVKKSCKLHYRSISVWKNVVTICWNCNQRRGNSTWTVVFQLCLCCYHGPVPQHPFHSPNKSASKMLLARTWLANWYLMCGPHGNSGSDDPDERGSLSFSLSLRLVAFAGNKFTANSASNTPNTFCQLFSVWPTPREQEICLPIRSHKHARPALNLYTCLCVCVSASHALAIHWCLRKLSQLIFCPKC